MAATVAQLVTLVLAKGVQETQSQLQGLGKESDTTQGKFDKLKDKAVQLGTGLVLGLGAAAVGVGIAAFGMSNTFNASMANVASLMPGATSRVNELKKAVQDTAIETGKSTDDMAAGLYQVESAFGDTADTAKILEINAKSATAGVASTTDAINLTSAVTKGYGDTSAEAVQHVSDLALLTVRLGQTTFPQLASSIGLVTPLANQLKVSQQELFGVMATASGVTGDASQVATQFRGVLQSLMAPTDSMVKVFDLYGVKSGDAMIKQQGLAGTIAAVTSYAKQQNIPLQDLIGSIEGQTLALDIGGPQWQTYLDNLAKMGNAAGVTDAAFKEQTEGVNKAGFAWQQMQIKFSVWMENAGDKLAPLIVGIGEKISTWGPTLEKVAGLVADFAGKIGDFANFLQAHQMAMDAFKAFLVGMAASILYAVVPALLTMATAAWSAITPLLIAAAPVIAIGLAIGGLIFVIIQVVRHWSDITTAIGNFIGVLGNVAGAIGEFIGSVLGKIGDFFGSIIGKIGDFFGLIGSAIQAGFTLIKGIIQGAITFIVGLFEWLYNHNYYFQMLVDTIVNVFNNVKNFIQTVWTDITTGLTIIWNAISSAASIAWNGITGAISGAIDSAKLAIQIGWNTITGWLGNLWNGIVTAASGAWDRFTGTIRDAWNGISTAVGTIISNITDPIKAIGETLFNVGKQIIQRLIDGVKDAAGGVKNALGDAIGNVGSALGFHGFASGTSYAPGGLSSLAENGMELVTAPTVRNLPRGAHVYNNADTMDILAGAGRGGGTVNNITVNNPGTNITEERLATIQRRVAVLYG